MSRERSSRRRAGVAPAHGDQPGATSPAGLARAALAARWPPLAWALALAALFALALVLRLGFQSRVAASLLGDGLSADARVYWRWAGHILGHGIVGRNLWFFAPLYPYWLAALRALTGSSMPAILAVQAIGGAAAVVLLADAARRLTRPLVGAVVGVALAAYPMAVFFDALVLMESLLFLLQALLLWWVARTEWSRTRLAGPLVLGVIVGVIALGRGTALLLALPALALLGPWRAAPRAALARAGALALGIALVVAPVALRNAAVSGRFVPLTYNAGFNLWVGQGPRATGSWSAAPRMYVGNEASDASAEGGVEVDQREYLRRVEHVDLDPASSSDYWAALAWREMRARPARALRLFVTKLGMTWNRLEYPQVESVREYRELVGAPGLPWLGGFVAIAIVALAGAAHAWRAGPRGRFVLATVLVTTLGIAAFFVTDRYRHQVVPASALLAAFGLEEALALLARPRERSRVVALVIGAAAGAALAFAPAPALTAAGVRGSLAADVGIRWLQRGRPDFAIDAFERAERHADADTTSDEGTTHWRAMLDYNYGVALAQGGRAAEARAMWERTLRREPNHASALRALARAYADAGRARESDSLAAALAPLPGGRANALAQRGWAAVRAGRFDDAERDFRDAVRANSRLYNEWAALVRLLVQAQRLDAADSVLALARDAGLPRPLERAHAALLAALRGRRLEAEAALAEVPQATIASDPTVADVVQVTRRELARR